MLIFLFRIKLKMLNKSAFVIFLHVWEPLNKQFGGEGGREKGSDGLVERGREVGRGEREGGREEAGGGGRGVEGKRKGKAGRSGWG
jgi:hypothetical protein